MECGPRHGVAARFKAAPYCPVARPTPVEETTFGSSGLYRDAAESAAARLHDPAFVALPVAVLFGVALIVLLLALGEADLQFRAALLPVQLQRHHGVTAPLHRADQMVEFAPIEKQFARTRRVGFH